MKMSLLFVAVISILFFQYNSYKIGELNKQISGVAESARITRSQLEETHQNQVRFNMMMIDFIQSVQSGSTNKFVLRITK